MSAAPIVSRLGDELLDHPDADPATVAASLHHIARSNRWFGGWAAVRYGLGALLAGVKPGSRLTLLDVGTGSGDLPRAAAHWAGRRGFTLEPLGVERHRTAAALALRSGVPTLLGCAGALPLRPGSVDVVLASQLVHHLTPQATVDFLRAATRVARVGVVIADLRRSVVALAGFWIGARLFRFDPATRADGMTSVRRGFQAAELDRLLRRAGIEARTRRRPGFRLVAAWHCGSGRVD